MALPMKRAPSMKEMKKKSVSKTARGVMAKALVFSGRREKTSGGLTKDKLMRSKRGKIVSKSRSALAKRRYSASYLRKWNDCLRAARRELSIVGFVGINGKTAQGKALYAKAKSTLAENAYEALIDQEEQEEATAMLASVQAQQEPWHEEHEEQEQLDV